MQIYVDRNVHIYISIYIYATVYTIPDGSLFPLGQSCQSLNKSREVRHVAVEGKAIQLWRSIEGSFSPWLVMISNDD